MIGSKKLLWSEERGARSENSFARASRLAPRSPARRAMSLIEVLISMFVLLFGLMGVAAIFPVGNFYVVEGEKFDLASGIAQNAFEELQARGMLNPRGWYYANGPNGRALNNLLFIQDNTGMEGFYNVPLPANVADPHPGHAFVLDPMGRAAGVAAGTAELEGFPLWDIPSNQAAEVLGMPEVWSDAMVAANVVPGGTWPVRRITLPQAGGFPFTTEVAETIFRLRDDLAVEQPDENDQPSIQRWDTADPNNTPNDLTDDTLLRRQYKGDYSWLATIVPTTVDRVEALQPANADYGNRTYDVSIVTFRKRVETPSAESERLIEAELLQGGELVIFDRNNVKQNVDDAVEDIRPGNWIALMGVNPTTGDFVMKWYRLLSLDDETTEVGVVTTNSLRQGRRAMLIGPDWPAPVGVAPVVTDLRVGIFPGVISVVTKPLRMEDTSLWSLE